MNDILDRYAELLFEVDRWFSKCVSTFGNAVSCRKGCSACCRGLFDITLLDALYLKSGIEQLPKETVQVVGSRSMNILNRISNDFPFYRSPWILNDLQDEVWQTVMPEADETPCVLLSREGTCLVYNFRPMTCRLHGIPNIDISGDLLSDEWCTLNFKDVDPFCEEKLRSNFKDIFAEELLLFRAMVKRLTGNHVNEIDTIIPAVATLDLQMVLHYLHTRLN